MIYTIKDIRSVKRKLKWTVARICLLCFQTILILSGLAMSISAIFGWLEIKGIGEIIGLIVFALVLIIVGIIGIFGTIEKAKYFDKDD